jgi:hypothetical protein
MIAEFAAANRLPAVGHDRALAEAGLLLVYGPDLKDLFRRAATFVDRILKGARPGDLPIEQPTKFDFVINLRTAHALGLTIPASVLQQATEFIQEKPPLRGAGGAEVSRQSVVGAARTPAAAAPHASRPAPAPRAAAGATGTGPRTAAGR